MSKYQNGDRVVVTEGLWSGSAGEIIDLGPDWYDVRLDHSHLVRSFDVTELRRPWEVEGKECNACGKAESKELGPVKSYQDDGQFHDHCAEELNIPEDQMED